MQHYFLKSVHIIFLIFHTNENNLGFHIRYHMGQILMITVNFSLKQHLCTLRYPYFVHGCRACRKDLQIYLVKMQVHENKNTPSDLIWTKCVRQKGTAHPQSNLPWECTTHNSSPLPTRQLGLFVVCALQKEMPVSYTNFWFCKNQTNGPSKNKYRSIAWNNDSCCFYTVRQIVALPLLLFLKPNSRNPNVLS